MTFTQMKVIDENKMNGHLNKEDEEKMNAFRKMDSMIKKGSVTDYKAELATYRNKKFGIKD